MGVKDYLEVFYFGELLQNNVILPGSLVDERKVKRTSKFAARSSLANCFPPRNAAHQKKTKQNKNNYWLMSS